MNVPVGAIFVSSDWWIFVFISFHRKIWSDGFCSDYGLIILDVKKKKPACLLMQMTGAPRGSVEEVGVGGENPPLT